jgi:hypothetical protein
MSDGNEAHGSSATTMERTKAIKPIFPYAPNFTAVE